MDFFSLFTTGQEPTGQHAMLWQWKIPDSMDRPTDQELLWTLPAWRSACHAATVCLWCLFRKRQTDREWNHSQTGTWEKEPIQCPGLLQKEGEDGIQTCEQTCCCDLVNRKWSLLNSQTSCTSWRLVIHLSGTGWTVGLRHTDWAFVPSHYCSLHLGQQNTFYHTCLSTMHAPCHMYCTQGSKIPLQDMFTTTTHMEDRKDKVPHTLDLNRLPACFLASERTLPHSMTIYLEKPGHLDFFYKSCLAARLDRTPTHTAGTFLQNRHCLYLLETGEEGKFGKLAGTVGHAFLALPALLLGTLDMPQAGRRREHLQADNCGRYHHISHLF